MNKVKLKKGDEVVVTRGKDRGLKGRVLRVFPEDNTVIVERANMIKRHTRANPNRQVQGGIVEREAPIQISNVKLICPQTGKATRVGRVRQADGTGARVAKVSGAALQ